MSWDWAFCWTKKHIYCWRVDSWTRMMQSLWICLTSVHWTCYWTSWIPGKFWIDTPSSMHQFAESIGAYWRGWMVSNPGNFILDLIQKSFVQLVSESRISPGDSGCKVIEINKIFYHPLIILHLKSFKLILHVSFGVVWSEVAFELRGELGIISDPIQTIVTHESRFKPV